MNHQPVGMMPKPFEGGILVGAVTGVFCTI